jgi:hypothetical protein
MKTNPLHIVIAVLAFACAYLFFSRRDKMQRTTVLEETYLQEINDLRAERTAALLQIDSLERAATMWREMRQAAAKNYTTQKQTLNEKRNYYSTLPATDVDARVLFFAKELAQEDTIPEW